MDERRKFRRRDLLFYSRVYDAQRGTMVGNLLNITPQGAMVLTDKPLEEKTDLFLWIELPEGLADKSRFEVRAVSLWCKPDINPEFYDVGFEFTEIKPEDVLIIQRLIEQYGFRD